MMRISCIVLTAVGAFVGASAHRGGLAGAVQASRRTLAASSGGQAASGTQAALAAIAEDESLSPVQRVVKLLGKMKEELMAEADKESSMYDKMSCWCETNQKEKTKAISDAETKDQELSSDIERRSARFGELSTEIAQLKDQIDQDSASLDEATALREKAAAEFKQEEKDLVQAITNLKNAVAVLAKHQGGSLLQLNSPLASGLRVLLRDVALKYELLLAAGPIRSAAARATAGLLQTARAGGRAGEDGVHAALLAALDTKSASQHDTLPLHFAERLVEDSARPSGAGSFVQAKGQAPIDADYKSYNARSGQIFGVLNNMLEEFNSQLSAMQKEEQKSSAAFAELAASKNQALTLGKEKLDASEEEHAENQKALSDAKEDIELTRKQRSADVEFLRNVKLTCKDIDKDWQRRSETRSEELKAVSEAIAILTEDDNREALAKATSFLQEIANNAGSTTMAARRAKAVQALRSAALLPGLDADDLLTAWQGRGSAGAAADSPRSQLSTLALTTQLDSFTKVKEMMDTMVAELKDQQKEEAEFKANCVKELNENEKHTYSKTEQKGDLEAKLDTLAAQISSLGQEVKAAKAQIADAQTEVKKASENREMENVEFQKTVADQRAMQAILKKALTRLQDFYSKGIGKKVIYLQKSAQTPPEKFTKYKDNAGATPVVGLLEQIVGDSEKLEEEAAAAESKAQADYESFVKDSNSLIAELSESVTAKTKASADAEVEAANADGDLKSTVEELESLKSYQADLHSQCDFVIKNFEIRQRARQQEMEAIQSAKAFLSGAAPGQ